MQKLVMVVDDSVTIRAIADLVFRKTEFELVTASSAVEALMRLPAMTPELIILDAEMPGVDGYALAKRLREMPATAETPVLLMVTDAGPDAVRLGDTDIDGYVIKPFTSAEFLDPVRMLTGAEVRRDVPLSFEQLMASRRAVEEQRKAELEAMAAKQKKSDEDELDFRMDDDRPAKPQRANAQNAAADLELPPPSLTPAPRATSKIPPPPPSRSVFDMDLKIEAPISARSNRPISSPGTPPPPAPKSTPIPAAPAPARPIGGPIGEPEPVEEPEQHIAAGTVRQPAAPVKKQDSGDMMVVEHVAGPVREPEISGEAQFDRAVTIPPQLRPRRYGFVIALLIAAGVAVVVWLRS